MWCSVRWIKHIAFLYCLCYSLNSFPYSINQTLIDSTINIKNKSSIKLEDSIETYYIVLWGNGFFSISTSTYRDWQKAGENNFSFLWELEPYFKTNTRKLFQEQKLTLRYGIIKHKELVRQKSDDELAFQSKWNRHLTKNIDLQALLKFQSQFNDTHKMYRRNGKDTMLIQSGFFSPAYINFHIGFEIKRKKLYKIGVGLSGFKMSIVKNQELYKIHKKDILFKVPSGKHELIEYGFHLSIEVTKGLSKNIDIEHKSRYFMQEDRYQHLDIESRTILSFKVSKHMKTMLTHQMIYDDDILNRVQITQQLMLAYYF